MHIGGVSRGRVRGTPTSGSYPEVGGGNYSAVGVRDNCLNCAEEKRSFLEVTLQRGSYIDYNITHL